MKGGGCCVKQAPTIVQVGGQGRGGGFQGQGVSESINSMILHRNFDSYRCLNSQLYANYADRTHL